MEILAATKLNKLFNRHLQGQRREVYEVFRITPKRRRIGPIGYPGGGEVVDAKASRSRCLYVFLFPIGDT